MNEYPDKPAEKYEIFQPDNSDPAHLAYYENPISAGFPSPAEDFLEKRLDLNEFLVKNPASTFLIRVYGESMTGAGIQNGDIIVVDRSAEAIPGKIILGVLNGEFTVKRLEKKGDKVFLKPENDRFKPVEITEQMNFQIWGVVMFSIHKV
jgi:DNA polymerase V